MDLQYDLYGPVRNGFDAGRSITRASGRGLGPGNRDFLGPCEMASSRDRRVPFGAQKSLDIQGLCPHILFDLHGVLLWPPRRPPSTAWVHFRDLYPTDVSHRS